MRYALGLTVLGGSALLSGCHIDMWEQPKMKAYYESDFYTDRQASRAVPEGTIARGRLRTDDAFTTGKEGTKFIAQLPAEAVQSFGGPKAMLDRGQERYTIYCSPCHGTTGNGNGFIAQRGLGFWQKLPATLLQPRLQKVEDGYLYDVLTHGKGAMYGYASRIQDYNDRWAVVAYVRALQLAGGGALPEAVAEAPAKPAEKAPATPAPKAPTEEALMQEQADLDSAMSKLSGDVLFDTAKATLKPEAQTFLVAVAEILKKNAGSKVEVGGHTDSKGNEASNQALSEQRARAVRDFLTSKGVAVGMLTAKGYGSSKPVGDNNTDEGRAKNRRITLVVQGGAK
ncbi:OmpA family protein [Armatimonas rosea]|uniref:Outer membrane protein OmpA-like peptidoglycan-associated protein n=1 Tax=Armatimonas rosea TaxID=685828 RepID=A0A7W9SS52_ARMRO|nr:OmpA family protein [Armatimonas rosea]MBB6051073.1 outer membrane protein OmpA-like peptidoglycan-associated protein [Armatimonas rosea]